MDAKSGAFRARENQIEFDIEKQMEYFKHNKQQNQFFKEMNEIKK